MGITNGSELGTKTVRYPSCCNIYFPQSQNFKVKYLLLISNNSYSIYLLLSTFRLFEGEDVAVRSFLLSKWVRLKNPLLSAFPIFHKFSIRYVKLLPNSALSAPKCPNNLFSEVLLIYTIDFLFIHPPACFQNSVICSSKRSERSK